MPDLLRLLEADLRGAKRIAILSVGSDLRADDAAGPLMAGHLAPLETKPAFRNRLKIILGGNAPENFTGVIREFSPDHIIVLDAADSGKRPGTIFSIRPDEVGGLSFSTHQLPLKLMIQYLQESMTCAVTIVGIQPGSLDFGGPVSAAVRKSATRAATALKKAVTSALHTGRTRKKRHIGRKRA
jgi:hydrogenase 3 maturation protease